VTSHFSQSGVATLNIILKLYIESTSTFMYEAKIIQPKFVCIPIINVEYCLHFVCSNVNLCFQF